MILDGYWKHDLRRIKSELIFWSKWGFGDFAEHQISRGLLYSAAIIRKIAEDEKDAERTIKKSQWPMPPLPIIKICVPVKRYRHTDPDKFFVNSKVILRDYDMQHAESNQLYLSQVCNQIIHSYTWAVVHSGKKNIYGVLVASDQEKEKDIILLSVADWINAIQDVIDKSAI